jgi:EAL and modified HD-GYP domain-containing signal transduction protein
MREICVGRQPIFDRSRTIVGWELLFRDAQGVRGEAIDGNHATASTLLHAIVEIGLDRVAGAEPVFINCTREFLDRPPLLPPERCVLEILEDIEPDPPLLAAIDSLRDCGYTIALDDFIFFPELAPLVERADMVKLDVLALGIPQLEEQVQALRPFGVKLIAEKVESEAELDTCSRMGFDYFQGYFLRRPEVLRGRALRVGKLSALTLLSECRKENASIARIVEVISSDAALSYRLLRLANSALFGRRTVIESISHAITMIGLDMLGKWIALIVLSGLENCPSSYFLRALERARMCELLAPMVRVSGDSAYLTGLLSILDSALEVPLEEVAPQLPVAEEIKAALVNREGGLGALLQSVIAFERVEPAHPRFGLPLLEQCFWEAATYARITTEQLGLDQQAHSGKAKRPRSVMAR